MGERKEKEKGQEGGEPERKREMAEEREGAVSGEGQGWRRKEGGDPIEKPRC